MCIISQIAEFYNWMGNDRLWLSQTPFLTTWRWCHPKMLHHVSCIQIASSVMGNESCIFSTNHLSQHQLKALRTVSHVTLLARTTVLHLLPWHWAGKCNLEEVRRVVQAQASRLRAGVQIILWKLVFAILFLKLNDEMGGLQSSDISSPFGQS